MHPIALYIHFPFCARKCEYCDFASYAGALDRVEDYLARLIREIDESPAREVSSIYIGGGTPSLLTGAQLTRLMDAVRARFYILSDAEISMELNPGTVDIDNLRAYRRAGINRLSFGAQAKQAHLLKMLGRIHKWSDVEDAVRMARAAGFNNINIDLMYALPNQTLGDWRETLVAAIALDVEHISAYSLILEAGTRLTAKVDSGSLTAVDDDTAIEMQRLATRLLGKHGYPRYEVSNYARAGYECRHNIVYWTRGDYLGLGAAAHSLMSGRRFANSAALDYAREEGIEISPEDAFEEKVMLGTRMVRGIKADGIDPNNISKLGDLVICEGGNIRLSEQGLELQNQVVMTLLGI